MAYKSINDLPEGLISQILLRLPVKSLLQCKSVCKPWLSLISTPHFIKSQLLHAIKASINTPKLLCIDKPPPTEEELAFEMRMVEMEKNFVTMIDNSDDDHDRQQRRRRQLVDQALLDAEGQDLSSSAVRFERLVFPRFFFPYYGVDDCCNGIVLLSNGFGNHVYFWNPSIRKCRKLPSPEQYTSRVDPVKKGFGYDSISDAYKFFRIVCEKMYDKVPIVQVYSTGTDSWREFRDPILKNYEDFDRRNVVVNGVLYFDGVDELISFDLHTEVFGQVPFPSWVTRKGSDVLDFEGSVAMVFQSGPEIHLWTLGDVSGQMSWTKKFSIEADSETEIWLTSYLGAGQFFGKKLFNEDLFMFNLLYDYRKKEYKFYKRRDKNIWAYLKYTETLVSLDGFEHVDSNTNNISLTGERRA
ncbi:hypothetical protein DCAR_0520970 [Daucus carota subsp. sativus]|uniref:F-box domain-containing protein n=1 Tax=Daucus carota subsp. sativus TaxID=79200 RepID=A0AAF0X4F1_DAUCS|nr:PREDICTED: putative F-box protein At4g21240 [Daucus carota subsp. sativus]WOH01586.1 hypothetical protein DCAR_0520970 [Daucus carota subsp. sativus]